MIRRALVFIAAVALAVSAAAATATDDKALGYFGHPDAPSHSDGYGATTLVGILILAGTGGWLFMKNRNIQLPGRTARRLVIDETKSLGSRQYLVVASYEGKKMLLGVCPGRIDLITPLDAPQAPGKAQ